MDLEFLKRAAPLLSKNLTKIQEILSSEQSPNDDEDANNQLFTVCQRVTALQHDSQEAFDLLAETTTLLNAVCDELGVSKILLVLDVNIKEALAVSHSAETLVKLKQPE